MLADEQTTELTMLCSFDDDLTRQSTTTSNHVQGLLTQIHPGLERAIGLLETDDASRVLQ